MEPELPRSELPRIFYISPLVRMTLLLLYAALTVPLPLLARVTAAPVDPGWLWAAVVVGGVALVGLLAERVVADASGLSVGYPAWVAILLRRRGWQVAWGEVVDLRARSTGQGGLVYYLVDRAGQGYLLPMRMAGFAELTRIVASQTGLDTRAVKPLAQPWMYGILLGCVLLLWVVDGWVIVAVLS